MTDPNLVDPANGAMADDPAPEQQPGAGASAEPAPADNVDVDIDELRRERDELYDRLLRKTAEFDNYRKRVDRERREQAAWAAADVLSDVIAVIDDFERALQAEAPPEAQSYREGLELIHRQLMELLRKRGVTRLETLGTDFDPHLHEAVAYEESPGAREGEIIEELRKGYRLGDRLLRPAIVRVAKAS